MFRILLLLFLLLASGNIHKVYGQSLLGKKITLEKNSGTCSELLAEISKVGGFTFSYNSSLFVADTITFRDTRQTVRKFLDILFSDGQLDYLEFNDYIVLRRKDEKQKYDFSGFVLLDKTYDPVPGAYVYIPSLAKGTISDSTGYFELQDLSGDFAMHISHISFQPQLHYVRLFKDSVLNFYMSERTLDLPGLTIKDRMPYDQIKKVEISKNELTIKEIKAMPAMFGEVDILRSLQFLPGIHTGGDINAGLFVRGGASDQSLIQLNGATLYNPTHFAGLFSVFNPETIKDVEIHKGSIPPRMGGRLSSVFNNHLKVGSKSEFKGAGGLGLISSRLTVEGPIIKNKASYILSGRRTYFDLFMGLSDDEDLSNSTFYFYDLNGSLDFNINDRNRINLSFYKGSDAFKVQDIIGLKWGNTIATLNWDSYLSDKLYLKTGLSYTNFGYSFMADVKEELEMLWYSAVREMNLKLDFEYQLQDSLVMSFGYQAIGHNFSPTFLSIEDNAASSGTVELDNKHALEQALYLGFEQDLSEKFSLQYGLRYSLFQNLGPGKVLLYENDAEKSLDEVTDTLFYGQNEVINTYHGPEPRLVARYLLSESSSIKAGYSRMRQYIQMASNSTAGNPTDRWIPADSYIKPQTADQVSIGYFRNFLGGKIQASAELYYRYMNNQIDFKEAVAIINNIQNIDGSILLNNYLETRLLSGKARAYGAEFLLKKQAGRFNGWISYTLSKVEREIAGINGGKPYSPRYDQTHDVSITANFEINPKLFVGANWVYNTGNAVTYPTGKYYFEGRAVPYYTPNERNRDRLPDYHRLDLSLTYIPKPKKDKKWQSSWNISLYNAYFRKNPVTMQFREVINDDPAISPGDVPVIKSELKPVMVYFTIMPSITYNFHF